MSWRTPTTADFEASILQDERLAWATASADSSIDTVAKAMADAIGRFRSSLRAGYRGTLGVVGTLPADLIPSAMHVAVYFFLGGRGGSSVGEARTQLALALRQRTFYQPASDLGQVGAQGTRHFFDALPQLAAEAEGRTDAEYRQGAGDRGRHKACNGIF
jgi:hypothetical protein